MWRMRLSLQFLLKSLFVLLSFHSIAQTSYTQIAPGGCKPPLNRVRWHDLIDQSQSTALKICQGGNNEEVNYHVSLALSKRIDDLQCAIEMDSLTKDQAKVGYLRGLDNVIKDFTALYRNRQFNASQFPA